MHRLHCFLSLLALTTLVACFAPDYGATGFACSDESECPSGYECRADDLCHRKGSAVGDPDADPNAPDADPNAPDADISIVANNLCGNAELLLDSVTSVGTLAAATSNDDYACGSSDRAEVFYSFTIAQARTVSVVVGSVFDTTLVLLDSTCTGELSCKNNTLLGESFFDENLAAGTYFVAVESTSGSTGSFTIELNIDAAVVRPPNDQCDGILELLNGVTRVGDTAALGLNDVTPSCGLSGTSDVVYEFTVPAPTNQRALIAVSNAAGFDPTIVLSEGGCPGAELLCGQDSAGGSELLDMGDLAPGTYTLWVDANGVAPSTFDIRLDLLPAVVPPVNDSCSAPDTLVENVVTSGTTTGASDDHDLVCLSFDSVDTVHQFTLNTDAAVLVTLEPLTNWALAASLRSAASCDVSADISCLDGAPATRFFNRPNQAAGSYDVVVDGVGGERGDYEISYETRPVDSGFGYWTFTTTDTYVPLGVGATSIAIETSDDEEQFAVTLPFDFPFYGVSKNALTIHTNGFLSFDAVPTGVVSNLINNDCNLDATSPFNMIAPFWDDLKAQLEGTTTIKHQVSGVAPYRRVIIEWANWDIFESSPCQGLCDVLGANVSHQAVLHENGDIEFRYGPRTGPTLTTGCASQQLGCSATVGLRNSNGTDNDQAGCNLSGLVDDGTVHYFVHPR